MTPIEAAIYVRAAEQIVGDAWEPVWPESDRRARRRGKMRSAYRLAAFLAAVHEDGYGPDEPVSFDAVWAARSQLGVHRAVPFRDAGNGGAGARGYHARPPDLVRLALALCALRRLLRAAGLPLDAPTGYRVPWTRWLHRGDAELRKRLDAGEEAVA